MVIARGAPILRSGFPRAGSPSGTQKRREFIHDILTICPDSRALWVPLGTDALTSTTVDRNARTLTWDATIAGQLAVLGSGLSVSFDGSADNGSMPDAANMSFGDASIDEPFSIVAWVKQTATATIKTIMARYDLTTGATKREWWFYLDAAEKLVLECYDESAGAKIGRTYNTALATGSWLFLAGTYSGSRVASGIELYSAAAQIDDTGSSSGSYVAMENTAALTYIGASENAAGAAANLFNGSLATVALVSGRLTPDQLWALKALGNAYYDLSL